MTLVFPSTALAAAASHDASQPNLNSTDWTINGDAARLTASSIRLVPNSGTRAGSAVRLSALIVDKAVITATIDASSQNADGFFIGFLDPGQGTTYVGGSGNNLGAHPSAYTWGLAFNTYGTDTITPWGATNGSSSNVTTEVAATWRLEFSVSAGTVSVVLIKDGTYVDTYTLPGTIGFSAGYPYISAGTGGSFGQCDLTDAVVTTSTVKPTSISSEAVVGTPAIIGPQTVAVTGISSTAAFGSADIIGPQYLAPSSISSSAVFGDVSVIGPQYLEPDDITSTTVVPSPTVVLGADIYDPPAITGLSATTVDMWSIQLDWDTILYDYDHVIIRRSTGLPYAATHDDDLTDAITITSGVGVFTYLDENLEPGTSYYYAVFTVDPSGNVANTGATATATTDGADPGSAIPAVVVMHAGTVIVASGTPVDPPAPGSPISITGAAFSVMASLKDGASWVKTLNSMPPPRPDGGYTGPGAVLANGMTGGGSMPTTLVDFPGTPEPTDIVVEIWDETNTTKIADLNYAASRQFLDEYNGVGNGSLQMPATITDELNGPPLHQRLLKRDYVIRWRYMDNAEPVFASIIEGRSVNVIANAGSQWVSVTGRGTLAWLDDAVVLPFYPDVVHTVIPNNGDPVPGYDPLPPRDNEIFAQAPDIRAFNFASRDAYDHDMFEDTSTVEHTYAGWRRANGIRQGNMSEGNPRAYNPKEWPDGDAMWIWWSDPLVDVPTDEVCWFRCRFNIDEGDTYRLFVSGDNGFIAWMDGIEVASAGYQENGGYNWKTAAEVDIVLDAGEHVLALRGQNLQPINPGQNPAGVLATLIGLNKDGKPQASKIVTGARTTNRQGIGSNGWFANRGWYTELADGRKVPYGPAWKAGDVLHTLVLEAQARGVKRLLKVTMDFDAELDSNLQPWTTRVSRTWDIGTSLLQVAFDLCELGVDIWMTPDNVLHCAERRGIDNSPFTLLYGGNISGYTTDEAFTGASVAYTKTRTGWQVLKNENAELILGGRRELGIQMSSTDSEDHAIDLSHRAIGAIVMSSMVGTAESVIPVAGAIPYTDVNISDIINALGPDGRLRKARLLSVSVSENAAGATTWVPEIEIWSSPFGDGVNPNDPTAPSDPNNPFDPSTWVPAAEDWLRFVPPIGSAARDGWGSQKANTDDRHPPHGHPRTPYTYRESVVPRGGGSGANSSGTGGSNFANNAITKNAERVHIGPEAPEVTAGFQLWVDTSQVVPGA